MNDHTNLSGQLCFVLHAVLGALLHEFPDGNRIISGAKRLRCVFPHSNVNLVLSGGMTKFQGKVSS